MPSLSQPARPCPCGAAPPYSDCCGPAHAGTPAATALALMRSRYSAFALGLADYLLATWHPDTRPRSLKLDSRTRWRRLQIVDTSAGGPTDDAGTVEFRAAYRDAGGTGVLSERSTFTREDGRWLYVGGIVPN